MITKNDCIILLTQLEHDDIDIKDMLTITLQSYDVNLDVVKFINSNRPLDASDFYEYIRHAYNTKKSQLYKNIVKENNVEPSNILTTLAALQLQILLYSKKLENKLMFLRHMRFDEISLSLLNYYKTNDIISCMKCLQAIKADLKAFEYMKK